MKNEWHNNTIICVDDEESVLDTYQRILSPKADDGLAEIFSLAEARAGIDRETAPSENKFNLLLVPSGEEALKMIAKEMENGRRVAAGFFDMRMPGGMDGYETIEKVRRLDPDLICSVVTAYTDREVEEIRTLFTDKHQDELLYIKKPFTADELDQAALNMVSAWNLKRRLEDHVRAIEKQRDGLRQILHAISTFSKIPPHTLEHLISGLLFQLLGIVEGENGFVIVFTEDAPKYLSHGVGKFENCENLARTMKEMPGFEKAFEMNRVVVEDKICSIPFLSSQHKLGGMHITSDHPILDCLDKELLEIFRNQMVNLIMNTIYHDEMMENKKEAITDPLTGLYNRRFIVQRLKEELNRSRRSNSPITMVMIDIDDFKDINDTYGHDAGDRILKTVGNIMRMTVRDYDMVGKHMKELGKEDRFAVRYGGEEFSLVLLDTESQGAAVAAERLRKRIQDHVFRYEEYEIRLTVSIGLCSKDFHLEIIDQDIFLSELIKKADEALYQAKMTGKNSVVVYPTRHIIEGANPGVATLAQRG
jgi:diguanylate cyclase (GGDEF)-like protein